MLELRSAINDREGLIDPRVFTDAEVYRQELDRIFRHTWLYVGHESTIPKAGDYLVNYMGEDEVIVLRDSQQKVRVFLNACAHRGNKVCLFNRGSQKVFTCTFHGWSYDLNGKLTGQAFSNLAYGPDFPRESWGLAEVPRVSSYGGLLFAAWDPNIAGLDDYLGDFRPYLEALLLKPFVGGIEVIPGVGKYDMPCNWKAIAENFMGDDYHVPITHASFFRASAESGLLWWGLPNPHETTVQILVESPSGAPHAFGDVALWGDPRPDSPYQLQPQLDRAIAERLGPEAVEWVDERWRRMAEYHRSTQVAQVFGGANWTMFPNLSLLTGFSAFRASSIIQWHPRGPLHHQAWQWCAVEKDAPDAVKRLSMIYQAADQAPAGMISMDDTENFERSADNLHAIQSHPSVRPFNYQSSGDWPKLSQAFQQAGLDMDALPGTVLPELTEAASRAYFRYYRQLMSQ